MYTQREPNPTDTKKILPAPLQGFFNQFLSVVRAALLHPRQFFDSMPESGGMRDPLMFYLCAAGVNALMVGIMTFSWTALGLTFLSSLAAVFVGAAIAMLLAQSMGGKGQWEASFRVFAYGGVCLLLSWVPIVGMAAVLYMWALIYFGLKKVTGLSDVKTVAVAMLSGILTCLVIALAAIGFFVHTWLHF